MAFHNVHKSSMSMKLASNNVSGNQRYTCTHTKTMYDVFAHNSLPTSAILALGLLKKKEWTILRGRRYCFLGSGASQAYFGGFEGCYQCGYYYRERIYSQINLKVWDSEEKLAFSSRLPLRRHIARLGTFSVDPGIVVRFYASAHHLYTTVAIDEWMIFWPSEDSPVEVGSTECSRHLVFESSVRTCKVATSNLTIRLLPATLQYSIVYIRVSACR